MNEELQETESAASAVSPASLSTHVGEMLWPEALKVEADTLSNEYGHFAVEALEPGFGLTIGHMLRRTLLSSIRGSAVFAVQIEGVAHEFTQLPGILEDVVQIILNIKNLDIQQFEDDIIELELIGEGPCILRGEDISTFNKAEILNPDCEIAHLEENATLSMTLYVRMNKGYVTAEENQSRELPVNVIYLDSNHSPIKRVNYKISTQTVDEQEQDQLDMEVWTSGAVNPIDSVAYAAKIMKEHMEVFINFDPEKRIEPDENLDVEEAPTNDNLYRSVSELELSVRSINCLQNAKIETIADLVQKTEAEMLRTKNFGRKSLNEIKTILSAMNLSLGMKLENFDPDANPVEKAKKE
jgi:DNA-directed RNA polymerase subunit alpha